MGSAPFDAKTADPAAPANMINWFEAVSYLNARSAREGLAPCYALEGCRGALGGGCPPGGPGADEGGCVGDFVCDAARFAGLDCEGYRLPTEAEWEYAARAGTRDATWAGPLILGPAGAFDAPVLDAIAWHGGNSHVASDRGWRLDGQPDALRFGSHPVGRKRPNPWGLHDVLGNVWEWTGDWYGPYDGDATDPLGPASGEDRVFRGGGWSHEARYARAANRGGGAPAFRDAFLGLRVARSVPRHLNP